MNTAVCELPSPATAINEITRVGVRSAEEMRRALTCDLKPKPWITEEQWAPITDLLYNEPIKSPNDVYLSQFADPAPAAPLPPRSPVEIPQPEFLDLTDTYMRAVHRSEALLELAANFLAGVEYDTLVGTGLSGTLAVANLARQLDKHYLVVRKPNDGSHSSQPVEGRLGKRWVFVDDLICTGSTLGRVWDVVDDLRLNEGFKTEFVGSFLYGEGHEWGREPQFLSPGDQHGWLRHSAKRYRGNYRAGKEVS